jgi:CDP-diacylglycerol--inositol 3-phosphatidyltransferase
MLPADMHIQYVLFFSCALNELFFIGLYLLCFSSPEVSTPLFSADIVSSTLQNVLPDWIFVIPEFRSAAMMEAARINKLNDTIPWMLVYISLPVMLFKQFTNIEQLRNACQRLAQEDRLRRAQSREEKTE